MLSLWVKSTVGLSEGFALKKELVNWRPWEFLRDVLAFVHRAKVNRYHKQMFGCTLQTDR